MERLSKKRTNMTFRFKLCVYDFLRDKCFRFRNFLNSKTKNMCFTKEELEEINNRVRKTKQSEKKFDEFSAIAPDVLRMIEQLRNKVDILEEEKQFCMTGIRDIYIADVNGNTREKEILFAKFGLPFVLQNENINKKIRKDYE